MPWVIAGVALLGFLLLVLALALINDPTLDPREFGDHLNPELTGNAGVSELVELAARVRKESKGHE